MSARNFLKNREWIYSEFYELQTYNIQTQYLASCVSKSSTKRTNNQAASHKNFSTVIRIMGLRVCKEFFLKTFAISNRRFRVVYQKKTQEGFTETDKRGAHPPSNTVDAAT